jgi:putative oxidoreductase
MAWFKNAGQYKNFGLLVIRVGLGILFIYHGLPKLLGGPGAPYRAEGLEGHR